MRPKGKYTKGMPHVSDAEYLAKLKGQCVQDVSGCWLWTRSTVTDGYGEMSYRGKQTRAHRLMYTLTVGPIPAGMVVMHSCDVRHCVNPAHLSLGTQQQNIQDAVDRGRPQRGTLELSKTHCPQGHAYAEHGRIDISPNGRPRRACKICQRAHTRKRAGWPKSHWYIESQQLGQRPSFGMQNSVEPK